MENLILNTIQAIIGTEPKPVWTEIDEKAFDAFLESIDFKRHNPDISYNQFKDYAYDLISEEIIEDIIVSGFKPETFEKGGILYYQKGITGSGVPSSKEDYVDLTGLQYLELVNKITGHDRSRRAERGREEISNLSRTNKPIIRLYKNGRIEYLGGKWNTGAGTGKNFVDKPGLFKRLINEGENKAQAIHEMVSNAIIRDNSILDDYFSKKQDDNENSTTYNINYPSTQTTDCSDGKQKYPEFPNECLTQEEYNKRKASIQANQTSDDKNNEKSNNKSGTVKSGLSSYYSKIKDEFRKLSPVKKMLYQKLYINQGGNKFKSKEYINFHNQVIKELSNISDQEAKERLLRMVGYSERMFLPKGAYPIKDIRALSDQDLSALGINREDLKNKKDEDVMVLERVPFMELNKEGKTIRYFPIGNRYYIFDPKDKKPFEGGRGVYTDEMLEETVFENDKRRNKILLKKNGGILKFQTGAMLRSLTKKSEPSTDNSASNNKKQSTNNNKSHIDLDAALLNDVAAAGASLASVLLPSVAGTAADLAAMGFGIAGRYNRGESLLSAIFDRDTFIDAATTLAGLFPGVGEVAGIGNAIRKLGKVRHAIGPTIAAAGVYMGLKDGDVEKITNSFNKLIDKGWSSLNDEDKTNLAQGLNILTSGAALAKNRTMSRLPDALNTNVGAARTGFRAGRSGGGFDVEVKSEKKDINPLTGKQRTKVEKVVESTSKLNNDLKTLKTEEELIDLFKEKYGRSPSEKELIALKAQNIETWRKATNTDMVDLGAVNDNLLSKTLNSLTAGSIGRGNIFLNVLSPSKSKQYDEFVNRVNNNVDLSSNANINSNTGSASNDSSISVSSSKENKPGITQRLINTIKNNQLLRRIKTPFDVKNAKLKVLSGREVTDAEGKTFKIEVDKTNPDKKELIIEKDGQIIEIVPYTKDNDSHITDAFRKYFKLEKGGLIKRKPVIRHILVK